MAVTTSSLAPLESINFNLVHNDPMQHVNVALEALDAALRHWHAGTPDPRPMTICPYAVVYESARQRTQTWDHYLQKNPDINEAYSGKEWEEEKSAYGIIGDAVHKAVQRCCMFYMVSMQNPVFSHSWHTRYWGQDTPELRRKFDAGDAEWHEFVLVLDQKKARNGFYPSPLACIKGLTATSQVYIYDPSYVHEPPPALMTRRNLKTLPLIGPKAYKMIKAIKQSRNLSVTHVFVGGGGNEEGDCRKMSLRWIRQRVEERVTTEEWVLAVEWEQVNFA